MNCYILFVCIHLNIYLKERFNCYLGCFLVLTIKLSIKTRSKTLSLKHETLEHGRFCSIIKMIILKICTDLFFDQHKSCKCKIRCNFSTEYFISILIVSSKISLVLSRNIQLKRFPHNLRWFSALQHNANNVNSRCCCWMRTRGVIFDNYSYKIILSEVKHPQPTLSPVFPTFVLFVHL